MESPQQAAGGDDQDEANQYAPENNRLRLNLSRPHVVFCRDVIPAQECGLGNVHRARRKPTQRVCQTDGVSVVGSTPDRVVDVMDIDPKK